MSSQNRPAPVLGDERGSVLLIALLMIVVFTIIGATFLTLSGSESQISTNHRADTQVLFVAESAAQVAYRSFAANNFQGFTNRPDGSIETVDTLLPISFPGNLVQDLVGNDGLRDERDDGAMVWEWTPGDSIPSITQSGLPESMRFRVRLATTTPGDLQFVIDAEGTLGKFRQRLQVLGDTQPVFNYALFADGPLCEFTRAQDQQITGRVHANGDMFFRPWAPRTLSIDAASVTATGRMIRHTDIHGRDLYSGSTVQIKDASGNYVEMALGAPGAAMDSDNADWNNDDPTDGIDGALELWDGIVRDGSLGAVRVDPPPVEALESGGWYDQRAGLRLLAGDTQTDAAGNDVSGALGNAVREVTFYNPALGYDVTVQELDVAALNASGQFPANGLIFAGAPLRIANADQLAGPVTIVSSHTTYTKGNFNTVNKRPAAIIAKGRVWHVSNAWSDASTATHGSTSSRQAANGTTTVNAAIVDGQPTISTAQCADLDGDGQPDDPGAGSAIENAEQLLESWGGSRTLRKVGSIVHLQKADMADDLRNQGVQRDEEGWIRNTAYAPPVRDYQYDPALQSVSGQPPFTIMVGRIYLWQQLDS